MIVEDVKWADADLEKDYPNRVVFLKWKLKMTEPKDSKVCDDEFGSAYLDLHASGSGWILKSVKDP